MFFYLINCLCKDRGDVWKAKSIVKAVNPLSAWDKFIQKWKEDYENGKADIQITAIVDFNVEKICHESEAIF
jgi:hypothetical protein